MKIGILGSGMIVPEFLTAMQNVKEIEPLVEVVAICGTERSRGKLEELATTFNIQHIFTDFQEMLMTDIDTVYIAVPNNLHFEMSQKAIESGKNVILEKPFTPTLQEAEQLILLANAQEVIILEAITNQYLPTFYQAKEWVASLGDIKIVSLNYSQYSSRYDAFKRGEILPAFDPKKAGGALMDLNIYNIHFLIGMFGQPINAQYFPNMSNDIDTSGILVLTYNTFQAVAIAAKDCNGQSGINIQGDLGNLESKYPANVFPQFTVKMNDGTVEECVINDFKHRMFYELKEITAIIQEKDKEAANVQNEQTLGVMRVIDAVTQR